MERLSRELLLQRSNSSSPPYTSSFSAVIGIAEEDGLRYTILSVSVYSLRSIPQTLSVSFRSNGTTKISFRFQEVSVSAVSLSLLRSDTILNTNSPFLATKRNGKGSKERGKLAEIRMRLEWRDRLIYCVRLKWAFSVWDESAGRWLCKIFLSP